MSTANENEGVLEALGRLVPPDVYAAELARLLNLDCMVCLTPVEERITPVDLIPIDTPCDELIGIALRIRPEAT